MIEYLKQNFNKEIIVEGFIDKIRNLQYVIFVILRHNNEKVQVTIEKENNEKLVKIIEDLTLESTVKITGKVLENEKVKLNNLEIIPTNIEITSKSLSELPFDYKSKDNSLRETKLDYRFLDLRREDNQLLFKVQSYMEHMMREYWYQNNYQEIHTPKISGNGAESGAEMFKLDYFGKKAYLSQSPQLYKQMVMASEFDKIFEIGPVFRAENSHTSYHATEIEMIDVEISWIHKVEEVMKEEENWIKYFYNKVLEKYKNEIEKQFKVKLNPIDYDIPRIDFYEVKKILKDKYQGEKEEDIDRKEEELIGKYVKKKYNSDFVFITNYPYSARSFYVKKDNNKTETFDLLYKGLEITSGAIRENRYDILKNQIEEKGLDIKNFEFYLEFFKYGMPPHGGFGVGMNRILMRMFEIDNIREATLIYRGPTRLNP